MNRHATQQHADARVSTPAATRPAEEWAPVECFLKCVKLFEYLADAKDTSMLENRHAAVKQAESSLTAILQAENSILPLQLQTQFLGLCTRAAANSINVVLQDIKSSLLLQSKLLELVSALCEIVIKCTRHSFDQQAGLEGALDKLQMEITAAGLPSALIKFTAAAWQALQQLDTNNHHQQQQRQQQQQQQQRPKHKHRAKHHIQQQQDDQVECFISAVALMEQLFVVWEELRTCLVLTTALEEVLPILIAVAATAPTLLQQAVRLIRLSDSSSPAIPKYAHNVRIIAARGVHVASFVATRLLLSPPQAAEAQQRQQQIIQADKLPELLLQLIAHEAAKVHKMCGGVSPALRANRAAAASGQTTEQQQQQIELSADCVVPLQHLSLLCALGLGAYNDEDLVWNGGVEMFANTYVIVLAAVRKVMLARHTAAQLNSNSTDSSHQQQQQQQQQQPGSIPGVLPSNLLVPAVKVLIEVLLLLPASNLNVHCSTLQLIKLLLTSSGTPPPAAAAAAAVGAEQAQPRAAAPWPQLPAAVAAGLLQPVIAQLSQAVIYCLLQTDPHKQQQQQSTDQQTDVESQRLAVLHDYGCLLLTICEAVEPKHIGAVLQSLSAPDLLISLAAIEAVIRAQACHLAPGRLQQQSPPQQQEQQQPPEQQEQQQRPALHSTVGDGSNSSSNSVVWSTTQHPLAHTSLLLLPFVSKVVHCLDSMTNHLLQQQGLTMLPTGDPGVVSIKLSIRVYTLLATALKVGKCAVAAAAPHQQRQVSQRAMANAIMTTTISRCWFRAACNTTNSSGGIDTAVQDRKMSVGLMFKALQACSCAMTSWAAMDEPQPAAAAAIERSSPATTVNHNITGVTLQRGMTGLDHAMGNAHYILYSLAHPYPALTQQQMTSPNGVFCEQVRLLAERSTHIRAQLMPWRGSVGSSAFVDTLAASGIVQESAKARTDAPIGALFEGGSEAGSEGGRHPSVSHLSSAVCDLADAVVPWFPLKICCNNPGCTTLTQLSEWQLVCGKACVCARCKVARYCSTACQQQHWQLHKPMCAHF